MCVTEPIKAVKPLHTGCVYIWYCNPATLFQEQNQIELYKNILSPQEIRTYQRLKLPQSQQTYLAAHGMLRHALSQHAPVHPQEWVFNTTKTGKPCIQEPNPYTHIAFNLTHSQHLAACAIATHANLGIDVEHQQRYVPNFENIAKHFCQQERENLSQQPSEAVNSYFLRLWTLKEAFAKATGLGLALPLHQSCFTWQDKAPQRVSAKPLEDGQNTLKWQFHQKALDNHWLALAYQSVHTFADLPEIHFLPHTIQKIN